MPITDVEKLQEAFSLSLEERSTGYFDLVSNTNALLAIMKEKGMMKPFSGPTIRERLLYAESGTYVRYTGYQFLNPKPAELFNDAEFEPKMGAVSVTLSGEEVLQNMGTARLKNVMEEHFKAAEQELKDRFVEDLHSDGSADGGLQIGGLQLAIPTITNAGVYGGISRANTQIWRTTTYDATAGFGTLPPASTIDRTSIQDMYRNIITQRSRGSQGSDCIIASTEHFQHYSAALEAIQRIHDPKSTLGRLGFMYLEYMGAGKRMPVVNESGVGSAMPANTTYFIDTDALCYRYDPNRNFSPIGPKQMPVNQDAYVRHIGYRGELTMKGPLFMAKLIET